MIDFVAALRRETQAFFASPARLDAPVPSCPEWKQADLVWHLGMVHWFWGTIAETRASDPEAARASRPERPSDDALFAWARSSSDRLATVLAGAAPGEQVWTWTSQHDVAWIQRRMAHETAVHRWDAQATTGGPAPVETTLAADGVEEFLQFFLAETLGEGEPFDHTVHLHCTDADGEWIVGPGPTYRTGHEKADVALRGSASDLMLALWRRVGLDTLEIAGDETIAERFIDRLAVS